MTVAIYARQSVERKDSVSIETQIEECKVRASRNDNIQVYSDEGFSGKNTERPDLQRLLEDILLVLLGQLHELCRVIPNYHRFIHPLPLTFLNWYISILTPLNEYVKHF